MTSDAILYLAYETFEGDIMLDGSDFEDDSVFGPMDDAISKKKRFWSVVNGIVTIPYTESNFLSHEERAKIQQAIAEYNSKTCVR